MSKYAAIHAGLRDIGLVDEQDKRDMFERVTGERSLRAMNQANRDAVLTEIKRLGGGKAARRPRLSGPYAVKLQALWIAAWNLGLVRDRSDAALTAFIKRQTGLESTAWLRDPKDGKRAVEALKGWIGRETGIAWDQRHSGYLNRAGGKIALAQVKLIHGPADQAVLEESLRATVFCIYRQDPNSLSNKQWIGVMNTLGYRVRAVADEI